MSNTLKQDLIEIIDIYLTEYTVDFDQFAYDTLWIRINTNSKKYEIFINVNEPWEKIKKRIKLNIEQHVNECVICNETKELIFCDECFNEHCLLCLAHIIVRNKGTPVCPFCRDGEDRVNITDGYNNALKKHRYEEALKIIESKYD
jgi:hypothetical protein